MGFGSGCRDHRVVVSSPQIELELVRNKDDLSLGDSISVALDINNSDLP